MADSAPAFALAAAQTPRPGVRRWSPDRLPLLWPAGLWTLGLMLARVDVLPLSAALAVCLVVILLLLIRRRWGLLAWFALACVWGVADLGIHAWRMQIPDDWLGAPVVLSAKVEAVQPMRGYQRLLLSDVRRGDGVSLAGKVLLYVHGRRHRADASVASVWPGDRIEFTARLRRPRNFLNPGAFDYRSWCFDRGIAAIANAIGGVRLLKRDRGWMEAARMRIRKAIAAGDAQASGVLTAILLGDRGLVSAEAYDLFSATGTAHLLAISGMHVGMAAAWMFALCWWLLTRREDWIVRLPVRSLSLLAGLLAAVGYASLAGWPLPAIRAGCMLAAGVLAWLLSEKASSLNTMLAALILILIADPSAIASISLWLSFLATAGILIYAGRSPMRRPSGRLIRAAKGVFWVSLAAMLATLPVVVDVFGRVPVYSLPGNLLLAPLYGLWVMPCALAGEWMAVLGCDHVAAALLQAAGFGVRWGLELLQTLADLPLARLWAVAPGWFANAWYALLTALAVWRWLRGDSRRAAGLMALALGVYLLLVVDEKEIDKPRWVVWDVGQGASSTLLLPPDFVVVVDAPGRAGDRFNGGTRVAQGLRAFGLTHVDVLIVSHAQADHIGGALSLIRHVNRVGEIWLPDVPDARRDERAQALVAEAEHRGIAVRWIARGWRMRLGEGSHAALFQAHWPPRGYAPANANNASLVVSADLPAGVRLLWPGDIEAGAEAAMLMRMPAGVDAMLMPHHGSGTSSSQAFIERLRPRISIAQTGFGNRYGFPDAAVVRRYQALGSKVYNTAFGAVMLAWEDGTGNVRARQWRPQHGRRREIALQWCRRHL